GGGRTGGRRRGMTGEPETTPPAEQPPWRSAPVRQHQGVPAWAAPRGGPPKLAVRGLPGDISPEWAFDGADGTGIRVCVLDSGVDPSHPKVNGVDRAMRIETDDDGAAHVVPTEPVDVAGHGTACSGVIRSLAPKCHLASVQVLTAGVQGGGAALLAGLRWAIDEGYDVVNMSLSTSKAALRTELAGLCDLAYFRRTL